MITINYMLKNTFTIICKDIIDSIAVQKTNYLSKCCQFYTPTSLFRSKLYG